MGSGSTSSHGKALEGVHGIHVVPHSPFAIEEITKPGDLSHRPTIATSISRVNQRLSMSMQRVWQQRPGCLRPIHCSMHGDQHLAERAANILTSLPFVALGLQAPRKNSTTKLYANSLIGVGVASCLYHSSRGNVRKYMKWLDYTMIATATVCLSRALRNENPKLLMAATAALLPIQPVMVSAIHTGMMEVVFAKRALEDPDLRMAHNVHKMSSLLGGVLFVADDIFPQTPFLHAGWHLAAAVGVGTCNKLLDEPLSMWMPDGSNNRDLDINSSVKLTKYMRSTKLKPAFCGSTTNFAMAAPSCSSYGYVNSVLAGTNHCHANGTENYKMELINEQQLGNGRWNPTPEQLHALEELYRCGKRTPTLDEIQYIASKLRRYGKIEGKNVFYWFQNHKARDRLKRHREDRTSCGRPEHGHQNLDNQECAGLSRKAHKLDHAKNSIAAPFFCKNFEVNGAAISMDRARAWSHFVQRDCHQKTGIVSTRSTLLNYEDYSSLLSKSKRSHHFQIHDKDETSESQTLQLFPLNSVGCSSTDHKVGSAKNDAEVPIKTINMRASACQFFEFLPLKN